MSDSMPVQRSGIRRIASPQPLPLTPGESESLLAAVQRIISASEVPAPAIPRPERRNPPAADRAAAVCMMEIIDNITSLLGDELRR
jgi:hypothetical protein